MFLFWEFCEFKYLKHSEANIKFGIFSAHNLPVVAKINLQAINLEARARPIRKVAAAVAAAVVVIVTAQSIPAPTMDQ